MNAHHAQVQCDMAVTGRAHAAGRAAACVWLTACVCTCHCAAMPSAAQVLWDLKPRPNSPDWLVAETVQIRKGLLTLRQNLVLVRDPENPDALYPRWAESCNHGRRSATGGTDALLLL